VMAGYSSNRVITTLERLGLSSDVRAEALALKDFETLASLLEGSS
jgi:16S rRNA A1518/A1519 N6-dimethyltransferase RsmA/KsgA/DIM1 with predicted DNA glycosylase/AP lyase activity